MSDRVAFTDIYVDDRMVDRAVEVLESGRWVKGEELEAFEAEYAEACGVAHAVGVSSGTAANLLGLQAAGIGDGDEVFVPGHTFFATVSPVLALDAEPVFVDIDPETYTMDPAALERAVEEANDPAAVMPVHIYGHMADMDAITTVADSHDLHVVADACQAHFGSRDGHVAGTAADVGAFSFYPSKNMAVGGDGGMLVTDDDSVARRARALRNHGREADGVHRHLGLNYRLDEFKAAVGREQLGHIYEWNRGRAAAAARYDEQLAEVEAIETPTTAPDTDHVYHLYVVQVPAAERDPLRARLDERGIDTGIHYERAAHQHPAVRERVRSPSLPRTERLVDRIVSLPMHPRITDAEIDRVCTELGEYFA